MKSKNISMIDTIAEGLGDKLQEVAFVGGSVLEFYVDDSAAIKPRPTNDVDIAIEVLTRSEYDRFEEALRKKGFINDMNHAHSYFLQQYCE